MRERHSGTDGGRGRNSPKAFPTNGYPGGPGGNELCRDVFSRRTVKRAAKNTTAASAIGGVDIEETWNIRLGSPFGL